MAAMLATLATTGLTGCKHATRRVPVSVVVTADPASAKQLVGGFYQIEAKAWRWTAKKFIVTLVPPPGSEEKGATLQLHFMLPESQIAKLGPMTLSADIDAYSLSPETYSNPGEYYYTRQIPANLLRTNTVPVIFTFDKASPPTPVDGRELGAVVSLIALNPK
jgi:hypothetical protein